jgi:ubiquinone/menaquinone biosynthesis C-methylase UbiE
MNKMSWTTEQLLNEISTRNKVVIELGCGPNPPQNIIGIDLLPLDGVHYVTNLEEGLKMIPDNSVDEVHSHHFMEHIQNFELMMTDIHRILKPSGKNYVTVPHFANPHYFSDYTHKRFFGLYTFDYFSRTENQLKRKVPAFYNSIRFKTTHRKIVFRSAEFPLRNLFYKWIIEPIFNFNSTMQEYYEVSFCYTFPPSELQFEMVPEK